MATSEAATANHSSVANPMLPNHLMKSIGWRRVLFFYGVGALILAGLNLAMLANLSPADTIAAAESGPQVVVQATRHDFGQVRAGTVLRHEFTVHNRGSGRIVLNGEGCGGCGDDTLVGSVIVPSGGRTPLPVTLETAARSGPLREVLTITTSDPQRARIEFVLTAHVVPAQQTARP